MTQNEKPREFYLLKDDLDFDLNWKKIYAAEYPYKDSVTNALRVIEYSAYLAIQQELDEAREVISFYDEWDDEGKRAREYLAKYPRGK